MVVPPIAEDSPVLPWWQKLSIERRKKIVQISKPELLKYVRQILQSTGQKLWTQYKIKSNFKNFEKELLEENLPQYYLKLLHRTMESILEQLQLVKQSVQELHLSKQEQFFVEFDQCLMPILQTKDFNISLMDTWLQDSKNLILLSQYFNEENNPLLKLVPLFQLSNSSNKLILPPRPKKPNDSKENDEGDYEGEDETSDLDSDEESQEKIRIEANNIVKWRESNNFFRFTFAKLFLEKIQMEFDKEESIRLQEALIKDEISKKKTAAPKTKPSKTVITKQIQYQKRKTELAFLNLIQQHVSQIVARDEETQRTLRAEEEILISEMEQRRKIAPEVQEIKVVQDMKPNFTSSKPIKIQKQKEPRIISQSPKQDSKHMSPDNFHSSPKFTHQQHRSSTQQQDHRKIQQTWNNNNASPRQPKRDFYNQPQSNRSNLPNSSPQSKQTPQPTFKPSSVPIAEVTSSPAPLSLPSSSPKTAFQLSSSPSTRSETLDSFLHASQEWTSASQNGLYSVWGNNSHKFDLQRSDGPNFSPHLSPIAPPNAFKLEQMFSSEQTTSKHINSDSNNNSSYHPLFSSINLSESSTMNKQNNTTNEQPNSQSIFSFLQSQNFSNRFQPFSNSPSKSTQPNSSLFSSE